MEDPKTVIMRLVEEENLIASAQHIVSELGMKKNLANDDRKILVDLGIHLLTMFLVNENKEGEGMSEIQEQPDEITLQTKKKLTDDERKISADFGAQLCTLSMLNKSKSERTREILEQLNAGSQTNLTNEERKILISSNSGAIHEMEERLGVQENFTSWVANKSTICDYGQGNMFEYVNAGDEAWKLTESSTTLFLDEGGEDRILSSDEDNELLLMAHHVLQMGMAMLEEEFSYVLALNQQSFGPVHESLGSRERDVLEEYSIISSEHYQNQDLLWEEIMRSLSEGNIIDLVHPDVIPHLNYIAKLMFDSNYGEECCQAYICNRKDALDNCLIILEMEKLSNADVLRMEWVILKSKIKRQLQSVKIFVRGYLASEKWLCDQIFFELGPVSSVCFVKASKVSVLQILSFWQAIAVGSHQPKKLFYILDMYEALVDLLPDIYALFSDEAGFCVIMECHDALRKLGDCVRATFLRFKDSIASSIPSAHPVVGEVQHMTRYTMNYLKRLVYHSITLNFLLNDLHRENISLSSPELSSVREEENTSPLTIHLLEVTRLLEAALDDKCRLYGNASLQHLLLMNNIHYMVQKVGDSEELVRIFGNEWIREQNRKIQHHAMNYERATWRSILSFIEDKGIPASDLAFKTTLLKEKLQAFNAAFKKVYRSQTAWVIPDIQLREDLRISICVKVIPAYRAFLGRFGHYITKYVKYSADDLQFYLLDLFEGSSKSI